MRNIENPFIPQSEKKSTSFFAKRNKPQPEIPKASAEMMVDLEDRFKTQEYLGKEMNLETLTFFKALVDQVGEDVAQGVAYDVDTKIDADGELKALHFNDCSRLESIPELPAGLTKLDCFSCPNLESIPELPAGLTKLDCHVCPILESLPKLPAGISELFCYFCTKIESLPELPVGLTKLHCSNCPNIEELPELPVGLMKLHCTFTGITKLPELPAGLTEFWCYNTPLAKDKKLIDALQKKHPKLKIYDK